jgi:NADH-quinone oxidoreductase subunit D
VATVERRPKLYEGSRIPSPTPTVLVRDPTLEDVLRVNFGPNHPSTHGVLRLVVDLHGERVVGLDAVIGYLHTGFEKTMEHKTYWKGITYPERIDYVSFQYNELVFVLAVEKLLGLEIPRKATWARMLFSELARIHSHLVYLGTSALEIGAISMFWYCFRERDLVLDLFEMVAGTRMHTRYFQVGGIAEDIPVGFYEQARAFCRRMPEAVDEYEAILNKNQIWLERTRGVGLLSAEDALALGQTGPNLRASGVDWDLRRDVDVPMAWKHADFKVITHTDGDSYARTWVRLQETREACNIVIQLCESLPSGPIMAKVPRIIKVPAGEAYVATENPLGEMGYYVISKGDLGPFRVKIRTASFNNISITPWLLRGVYVPDIVAILGSLYFILGDIDR